MAQPNPTQVMANQIANAHRQGQLVQFLQSTPGAAQFLKANPDFIRQLQAGQQAQQQQQQQAQQQQQQQQPQQGQQQGGGQPQSLEHVLTHLFPPQLSGNLSAAATHLHNVLFPPNVAPGVTQTPLLSQVMVLAQNGHLTPEQMTHLKNAVAMRNTANQANQANGHPTPPSQQTNTPPQQYTQAMQNQIAQHQNQLAQAQAQAQVIAQLQSRITQIEGFLGRPDLAADKRAAAQAELDNARNNLQRVVKTFLANGALQNARAGQTQMLQQQQAAAAAQFRTNSPAAFQQGQNAAGLQGSPAAGVRPQLQGNASAVGTPTNLSNAPSPADSAKGIAGGSAAAKKLSKKAQQVADQTAAAAQAAQAQAQAQALASHQATSGAGGAAGINPASTSYAQPTPAIAAAPTSIPQTLSMPTPTPETFPAARPTLSSGLANTPIVSTPALIKPAGMDPATVANALGKGREEMGKDTREDSKGRTVSKRKLRDLVESVDPEERLSDDVEDLCLDIADEFIDSITRFACQLAKHRKSDRLEVKDLALHLERNYAIKIPGFGAEETRTSQSRRLNLPPGYQGRVNAVREARKRR